MKQRNALALVALTMCAPMIAAASAPGMEYGPRAALAPDPAPVPWAAAPKGGIPQPATIAWLTHGQNPRRRSLAERKQRRAARRQRGKR